MNPKTETRILSTIRKNNDLNSVSIIAEDTGLKCKTIQRYIKHLKTSGKIDQSYHGGYYTTY